MKTNRTLALLLTATLFAAAFAGCIGEDEAEDTTETVKIGFLNPQTGPLEADAPGFSWGVAQAIDDLNAMPGDVVFEAVEVNSGCDGTVGSTGAQTLVDSGVVAVVGAACSGASMGANAEKVENPAELAEAFKRAQAADKTSVIVMNVDAYEGWTTEGHTWWEVGTPHITEHDKVRAAHEEIESVRRERQRRGV